MSAVKNCTNSTNVVIENRFQHFGRPSLADHPSATNMMMSDSANSSSGGSLMRDASMVGNSICAASSRDNGFQMADG